MDREFKFPFFNASILAHQPGRLIPCTRETKFDNHIPTTLSICADFNSDKKYKALRIKGRHSIWEVFNVAIDNSNIKEQWIKQKHILDEGKWIGYSGNAQLGMFTGEYVPFVKSDFVYAISKFSREGKLEQLYRNALVEPIMTFYLYIITADGKFGWLPFGFASEEWNFLRGSTPI
jgi:hypothetical protein